MSSAHSSDDSHASDVDSEDEVTTTKSTLVVTKYKMAADIANAAMKKVVEACVDGAKAGDLCDMGDKIVQEMTAKVFHKKEKEVQRGSAFPTCVSVNNVICHYSPLKDDDVVLKTGDMVKIDVGAHIDGYIGTMAHTLVVGATAGAPVTGRKADVMHAAYQAMEAAVRMLKPGVYKNNEVTEVITKVSESFKCKPIENMLSHQLEKDKIDGMKVIIQNPGEKQRSDIEKIKFENHEVYAIDILCSTGEGKTRESDKRTTVYKKADEMVYNLKMKHSRQFLSEIMKKHGDMPFSLRHIEEKELPKAKMALKECVEHGLMKPYPVIQERDNEFVAQFKCTVLIMPSGLLKITGMPLDADTYKTDHKVEDAKAKQILESSLKPKKKKAKKAKAPAAKAAA